MAVQSAGLSNMAGHLPFLDEEDVWRAEIRRSVKTLDALEARITLTDDERIGVTRALSSGLPMAITPYYLGLVDAHDPACPIRKQVVPLATEAFDAPGDLRDPLGEEAHQVAPHLVQRYPDRVLFLVTDTCSIYCRFCTRSRMVGMGAGAPGIEKLEADFEYIRTHPEIQDVIVSGGDPLVMANEKIERLLGELARIDHVLTVRVASRTPVTLPSRVTQGLCRALRAHPSVWLMTHFNHPKELTQASRQGCRMLADAGIPVMNQTVLLRGINDNPTLLEQLFRGLVRERVRPYYLLQMDPVRGTSHLRTKLDVGIALMEALQGRLSGIALPKFIVDTPGGHGKVPLLPNYVVAKEPGKTTLRTFRDAAVVYLDPSE